MINIKNTINLYILFSVVFITYCFKTKTINDIHAVNFKSNTVAIIDNIPITNIELLRVLDKNSTTNDTKEVLWELINNKIIHDFFIKSSLKLSHEQITLIENSFNNIDNIYRKQFLKDKLSAQIMIDVLLELEYKDRLKVHKNELIQYKQNVNITNFAQNSILIQKKNIDKKYCNNSYNFIEDKLNNIFSIDNAVWVEINLLPDSITNKLDLQSDLYFIKQEDSCDIYKIYEYDNAQILDTTVNAIVLDNNILFTEDDINKICATTYDDLSYQQKYKTQKIYLSELSKESRYILIQNKNNIVIDLYSKKHDPMKIALCNQTDIDKTLTNNLEQYKRNKYKKEIIKRIQNSRLIEIREQNIF